MSVGKDPPLWSEAGGDAPPDLQRLLASARSDVPGPRALAALGIVLPNLAGGGAALATAKAQAAATALAHGGGGVAAGGAAGGAAAGSAVAGSAIASGAAGASLATKIGAAVAIALLGGGGIYYAQYGAKASDATQGKPQTAAAEVESVAEAPRQAEQHPAAPPEPPTVELPTLEQGAPTVASPANPGGPEASKATPKETELGLLQRARAALRTDPKRALALADRHRQEFPESQFAQEREVIRIEALRKSGNEAEAARLGEEFNARYPGSAHETKLKHEGQ